MTWAAAWSLTKLAGIAASLALLVIPVWRLLAERADEAPRKRTRRG